MKRREFIKQSTLTTGILSLGAITKQSSVFGNNIEQKPGFIPRRRYGKTDVNLSVIGFGGIVVRDTEQKEANRIVAEAYERGVNYFDVAPSYGDAEIKLGPALKPYRKKAFLSCKTACRDYPSAKEEFEQSLKTMETDYFDLYQLHAITNVQRDVEPAFADDGVMKLLLEEKKQGRIRYLGFSAHSPVTALEALNRYDFDSVMFPVNFAEYLKGNFSPEVIEYAHTHDIAILALKMLARQRVSQEDPIRKQYPKCWYQPITETDEAKLSMAFTLGQPAVTSAIPPGDERLFKLALDLLPDLKPVTEEQVEKLNVLASDLNPIFTRQS